MDVAALLGYVRATWPYFNASLRAQPNHLLLFPGDMAMDLPRPRMQPPLSPEVDASQVRASDGLGRPWMTSDFEPDACEAQGSSRHFIALTLTGNPEVGFVPGKDVVFPPTHDLKGGPTARDRCCGAAAAARRRRRRPSSQPDCKLVPISLASSPWGPAVNNRSFVVTWAGQASGGGMGRHGGSGVRVRRWLSTASDAELPLGSLVTGHQRT